MPPPGWNVLESLRRGPKAGPIDALRALSQASEDVSSASETVGRNYDYIDVSSQQCRCRRCVGIPWERLLDAHATFDRDEPQEYEIGPVSCIRLTRDLCKCRQTLNLCDMALPTHLLHAVLESNSIVFVRTKNLWSDVFEDERSTNGSFRIFKVRISAERLTPALKEAQSRLSSWNFFRDRMSFDAIQRSTISMESSAASAYGDVGRMVKYQQIRRWMDTCVERHGRICQTSDVEQRPISMKGARMINVWTEELVQLSGYVKFAALSYVWGESPHCTWQSIANPQKLPDSLCRTVRDAMQVVKELGLLYLWVDRYCIDPHDKGSLTSQIKHMDEIYRTAYITILALSGDSCEAGLPGVSKPFKRANLASSHSSFGALRGHQILNLRLLIDASPWKKRAWTMQEAAMSERKLGFLDETVFLECISHLFIDQADPLLDESAKGQEKLNLDGISYQKNVLRSDWTHAKYARIIEEYTSRRLSHQEDALLAIQGLFTYVAKLKNIHFYMGHPITDFIHSLLWYDVDGHAHDESCSHQERRKFPSWSWCSRSCQAIYDFKVENIYKSDDQRILRIQQKDSALTHCVYMIELETATVTKFFGGASSGKIRLKTRVVGFKGASDPRMIFAMLVWWRPCAAPNHNIENVSNPNKITPLAMTNASYPSRASISHGVDQDRVYGYTLAQNSDGSYYRTGIGSVISRIFEAAQPQDVCIVLV